MKRASVLFTMFAVVAAVALVVVGCQPPKSELVKRVEIPDNEIDPAVWGKAYPTEYEMWKKTEEPTPAGKSPYKKGFDADKVTYDKLSEYPFLALLFNGWGFGIEYNEPRGHAYMVIDQLEIDPSRIGAGGVCLSCKTPITLASEVLRELQLSDDDAKEATFSEGKGCVDCNHTGYSGRTGVYEFIEMTQALVEAINHGRPAQFVAAGRRQMAGHTLARDAAALVLAGRTTVNEAMRISHQLAE